MLDRTVGRKIARTAAKGVTLVELAVMLALIAIFATFAVVSFGGASETSDAKLVESTQAALQAVISQGAARLDMTPAQLVDNRDGDIVNALRGNLQQSGTADEVDFSFSGGNNFLLELKKSGRSASYTVTVNGDVQVVSLSNFPSYTVSANGTITKN